MKNCTKCHNEVPDEFEICWNCSYNFKTNEIEGFISDNIKTDNVDIKPKKLDCLRCQTTMTFESTIKLHEGKRWGVLGEIGHLLTNKESFDMYICPNCDKVEFFTPSVRE